MPAGVKQRLTYEKVRDYFAEHGCTLLSDEHEFVGHESRLRFRCPCGNEVTTRWEAFKFKKGTTRCLTCAHRNTREKSAVVVQSAGYKESRRAASLAKYGVDVPSKHPSVKAKQKDTLVSRYGVEHILHIPEINARQRASLREVLNQPEVRKKYQDTILDRYGVPSLAFLSRRTSTESSVFFGALFALLPSDMHEKCYFSPHTREFNVWYERKYYKYDFVHSRLKRAIEYNGSRFHPRPEQHDDEVGWCLFRPTRTVREAREYEQHKLDALRARGFEVLVVWDYEVKHDLDSVLDRCLSFLGITPRTSPTFPPSSPSPSGS